MSRIEFMSQLTALLQDISAEERTEALQYYSDYFDDAGVENEQGILHELGSPEKVAAVIKTGLRGQDEGSSEYRETGYKDTRFETKEDLMKKGAPGGGDHTQENQNNRIVKIILIALIVIVGTPVVLPVVLGLAGAVFGLLVGVVALFVGLFVAAVAVAMAGLVVFFVGLTKLVSAMAVGLLLCGGGLLAFVIGSICTVGMTKVCITAIPAMFRWVVELFRRLFNRRAVV